MLDLLRQTAEKQGTSLGTHPSLGAQVTLLVNSPLRGHQEVVPGSCGFQDGEAAGYKIPRGASGAEAPPLHPQGVSVP